MPGFSIRFAKAIGFFGGNLVMEYTHVRAVLDGVNVGYDVYREFQQFSEFEDKEVNTKLIEVASAVKRLREYTKDHYDALDDMSRVRFHRPSEAEGGHQKYEYILEERAKLVAEMDKSVTVFHRAIAQRLPQAVRS